jgi:NADPH-dependent curcumin reductase CurA
MRTTGLSGSTPYIGSIMPVLSNRLGWDDLEDMRPWRVKMIIPETVQHVVLASRPNGAPTLDNFAVEERNLAPPQDNQVLIQNLYISLDAGFRNWMDEGSGDHILPAMVLGEPVMGLTLGRVIDSRHGDFKPGQILMSRLAWEEYSVTDGSDFLVKLDGGADYDCPLSWHMGILGDTGMSGYFGMTDIGRPQPGETVLVSAAGGAVGSVAGQIARIHGARVVGIAGGADKCRRLIDELGYDDAIDRHGPDMDAELSRACPDGVDVYFDSVGGPLLESVLDHIAVNARIALCGSVANYNATEPIPGPSNLFQLVTNQAHMEGFMTHLSHDRYPEARQQLLDWVEEGRLLNVEYMLEGIENVPVAFCDLFSGRNFGKTVVRLVDDEDDGARIKP